MVERALLVVFLVIVAFFILNKIEARLGDGLDNPEQPEYPTLTTYTQEP